jgi:CRP-like cAMP-binding protein
MRSVHSGDFATGIRNTLLAQLPHDYIQQILPMFHRVWLPAETRLVNVEDRTDYAYFPESNIVAVAAVDRNGNECCVGLYGFEGFGGTATVIAVPTSPNCEIVQLSGYAYQIRSVDLRQILAAQPDFHRMLLYYVHVFMMQVAYTALSNSSTRVEQRLARWLLMYQDRSRASTLAVTHQRLSAMLGIRRSGVTEAVHVLEERKLVRAQRGLIDILDRRRLEELTAGTYGHPETEYRRLI